MPFKNPEAAREYQAAYRGSHRDIAKARTAQWRLENPGGNAENAKRWREKNLEKAAAMGAAWRLANREKIRQSQKKWRDRTGYNQKRKENGSSDRLQLKRYGLTQESFDQLLAKQGGVCAICARPDAGSKTASRLYVDHCHNSNRVRGLLCRSCNVMLGCAHDKPELLMKGAAYLER